MNNLKKHGLDIALLNLSIAQDPIQQFSLHAMIMMDLTAGVEMQLLNEKQPSFLYRNPI